MHLPKKIKHFISIKWDDVMLIFRYLSSNNIRELRRVHLEACLSLSTLVLSNNDIQWIEDGILQHIKTMREL